MSEHHAGSAWLAFSLSFLLVSLKVSHPGLGRQWSPAQRRVADPDFLDTSKAPVTLSKMEIEEAEAGCRHVSMVRKGVS